jgi:hypothetical protein
MAKSKLNGALSDIRGRLEGWVYRRNLDGGISICPIPVKSSRPSSEAQVNHRQSFRDAAAFARSVLANPATRPTYEALARELKKPVFSLAIRDYFQPPRVSHIGFLGYHGRIGDPIVVRAIDDVEVMSVALTLLLPDDSVVEQGAAVKTGEDWIYTATAAIAAGQAIKVRVTAMDRPENEAMREEEHTVTAA